MSIHIVAHMINLNSMFFLFSLVWIFAYIDDTLCQIWCIYMQYFWRCDHSNKCLFLVIQQAEVLLNFFWWVYVLVGELQWLTRMEGCRVSSHKNGCQATLDGEPFMRSHVTWAWRLKYRKLNSFFNRPFMLTSKKTQVRVTGLYPVADSPQKGSVKRKVFSSHDIIMLCLCRVLISSFMNPECLFVNK